MSACYTEMEECRCDQEAGGVREKLCGSGPPLHLSPRLAKPIFRFHVASCSTLVFSLYARKISDCCYTCGSAPSSMILIGFDIGEISEDGADDVDGMDASAAHIANLLSSEPPDAWVLQLPCTLPLASRMAGRLLPSSALPWKRYLRFLRSSLASYHLSYGSHRSCESTYPRGRRVLNRFLLWKPTASLFLLCFLVAGDGVVPYSHGERSAEVLRMSGFRNLTFKTFNGYAPAAAATSYFHF
ncbi:hypothetical protein BHE74_00021755 [Ensete ventricosum]|nr:hypothetical protein GW17_00037997 [Ensete ventricosum]RWW70559.1 hypothetical protein BHE74_00021755 [Ensete ventricosum]RZS00479.1 hypothetical protein BHM03_00030169 [Ensete ventricosum]